MKKLSAGAAIAAALLLTACAGAPADGGNSTPAPTEQPSAAPEVTAITVGVIPTSDTATVYVAADLGFFEEEGLDVTMEVMQNAAAIVPGVMNGQVQFGSAAVPPVISAISEGLPIRIVANAGNVPVDAAQDPSAILVKADSGFDSAADLEGTTVAVNALQAMGELATRQAIANAGGDPALVTFVAMPFPDMANAVERGDVAAAFVVEPFLTSGVAAGLEVLATPYHDSFVPGATNAVFFASDDFIGKAPNSVAAFQRALAKAAEAATADPDLIREALITHGKVAPEVANAINLPEYSAEVSEAAIERFIAIMVDQGFLTGTVPTVSDVIAR